MTIIQLDKARDRITKTTHLDLTSIVGAILHNDTSDAVRYCINSDCYFELEPGEKAVMRSEPCPILSVSVLVEGK